MTTTFGEADGEAPRRERGGADHHWTADQFYRAADAGVFDDPGRLELIHGRIVEKMPQGSLHRACRVRVSRRLRSALASPLDVVDECPIHIAFDGEPIPNIVVLKGMVADDPERHPSPQVVALLVEVSVSSEEYDLGEKALLYAQAGIAEYWVVLPERGQVLVHRGPTPEGYGWSCPSARGRPCRLWPRRRPLSRSAKYWALLGKNGPEVIPIMSVAPPTDNQNSRRHRGGQSRCRPRTDTAGR